MADLPNWVVNKLEYNKRYDREHKVNVAIKLNKATEPELVEIYQAIPNKSQWFKECLRKYAQEHPEVFTNKKDPDDWPE